MKINGRHESKCVFTSVLNRVGRVPSGSRGSEIFRRGSRGFVGLVGQNYFYVGPKLFYVGPKYIYVGQIFLRGSNLFTWVREKLVGQNFP